MAGATLPNAALAPPSALIGPLALARAGDGQRAAGEPAPTRSAITTCTPRHALLCSLLNLALWAQAVVKEVREARQAWRANASATPRLLRRRWGGCRSSACGSFAACRKMVYRGFEHNMLDSSGSATSPDALNVVGVVKSRQQAPMLLAVSEDVLSVALNVCAAPAARGRARPRPPRSTVARSPHARSAAPAALGPH